MKRWVRVCDETTFSSFKGLVEEKGGGWVRQNKLQASKEIFDMVLFGIFSHGCSDDKIDRAEATIAERKQGIGKYDT